MYTKIGKVSDRTLNYLSYVSMNAQWKDVIGPEDNFKTWFYNVKIKEFPEYEKAFFLMIPAGGRVHKHTDTARPEETYHIPIKTNDKCINIMYPGGDFHLEVGNIYHVDRQIEHESFNNGKTDRIHLLVEK